MNGRGKSVLAVVLLFALLSWIAFSLRIYTRRVILNSWGKDDWAMFVTLILFTTFSILQSTAAVYGSGQHRWNLSDEDARIALLNTYLCTVLYLLSNCSLKVALGIFYLRFAVYRWHIFVIRGLMGTAVLFGLVCVFLSIFQCRPASEYWNNHPASEKCTMPAPVVDVTIALSAANIFTDWALAILPIFIVRALQMKRKNKILVAGILAFASIGSTATLVRVKYTRSLGYGDDFLYATYEYAIWSTIEVGVGITAGNIATLRPLLQEALSRIGLASTRSFSQRGVNVCDHSDESNCRRRCRHDIDLQDLVPHSHSITSTTISGPVTPNSWTKSNSPAKTEVPGVEMFGKEGGSGKHQFVDMEEAIVQPPEHESIGSSGWSISG